MRRARDRAGTPFVRCDNYGGSTIFLRGPIGSQILNDGSLPIDNPVEVESDNEPLPTQPRNPDFQPTVAAEFACGRCATVDRVSVPIQPGQSECPRCHEPIEWPDQENPDGRPAQVERGIRERHQGRVSDVQRVFEKMRREVESGEGEE